MNHVEFMRTFHYMIDEHQLACHGILAAVVLTNRPPEWGDKPRICDRVAAREQSYILAAPNQFFSQIRDNAFGASIVFGRHTFDQRRNLSDSHFPPFCCEIQAPLTHRLPENIIPPLNALIATMTLDSQMSVLTIRTPLEFWF